jgi:hypothetical protein
VTISYFVSGIAQTANSAIALTGISYGQVPESTVYNSFGISPLAAVAPIPSAAIIFQMHHGRETALVDEYQALDPNWDGYDADQISQEACSAAKTFLVALPSHFESPELCPNPGGTISMAWQSSNGQAQLDVGKSKFSFYMRQRGAATLYHKGDAKQAASVCAFLAMLYANPRPVSIADINY